MIGIAFLVFNVTVNMALRSPIMLELEAKVTELKASAVVVIIIFEV